MNIIRTILAVTSMTTLVACSNAPSESEIEKAIESSVLKVGCKTILIRDIKKLNGIKMGDDNYLIKSEFTIVVNKDADYVDKFQAHKDAKAERDSAREASEEGMSSIKNKILEISKSKEMHIGYIRQGMGDLERKIAEDKIEEINRDLNNAKFQLGQADEIAYQKIKPFLEKVESSKRAMASREREIENECVDFQENSNLALALLRTTNHTEGNPALLNGVEKSYDYEFTMIKSDNGWISKL